MRLGLEQATNEAFTSKTPRNFYSHLPGPVLIATVNHTPVLTRLTAPIVIQDCLEGHQRRLLLISHRRLKNIDPIYDIPDSVFHRIVVRLDLQLGLG